MKKCLAIAALLLASTVTAAQAQYSFEYNGRTITIDPDRGTVSIPGVYDNTKKKRLRGEEGDLDRPARKAPQQAKTAPTAAPQAAPEATAPAAPAPAEQAAVPAVPPPAAAPAPSAPAAATNDPSTATAAVAPADTAPAPAPPAAPQPPQAAAPAAPPAPVAAPAQPPPQKQAAAPAASAPAAANSPVGVWLTEEKEGKVRIEQCGPNLCGYAIDKKSNQNGEQVLINMKPSKDKWSGRILDPNSGSTYDSTIAMKGTDTLRVQGCAFGGMFCGGQTWTRVN
jgi:uncharacterized protein (DUF2147 family)